MTIYKLCNMGRSPSGGSTPETWVSCAIRLQTPPKRAPSPPHRDPPLHVSSSGLRSKILFICVVQAIIASSLIQGFIRNRLPLCAHLIPHLDIRFSETHRPNFLEQKPLAPIDHFQRTYIAAPDLETKHLTLLLFSI